MEQSKVTAQRVDKIKQEVKRPDDEAQRRRADIETAAQPASGAPVQRAAAGAALSAGERASESGETADALKRAAENDTRI